jgi:hypothetical protein
MACRGERCAQIFDERSSISGIDKSTPLDHLVEFFRPYFFAQSLLPDYASVMALRAGSVNFGLNLSIGQIL